MKKLQSILRYTLTFLCFPVVVVVILKLVFWDVLTYNATTFTFALIAISAIIGLCWQCNGMGIWCLAILLPVSLATGFFCYELLSDVSGRYFNFMHAWSVLTYPPLWMYAAATFPGLLTTFLGKFIKTRWLRLTCVGVLGMAVILAFLPTAFRFYSANTVKSQFDGRGLYDGGYSTENLPSKSILASHSQDSFYRKCIKNTTTMEEVHTAFGKPHVLLDSGLFQDVYFTRDGLLIYISYSNGVVTNVHGDYVR